MSQLHVVFGANGGAGRAVVRSLADAGRRVRAVSRSGTEARDGVEGARADARDADAVRRACEGAAVVYHCVNVPYPQWSDVLPAVMDALIDGAASAGARLVYCDNLYMYGPVDGPLREDSPRNARGSKGRLRIRLAERLLAAHAEGRVEATIGRGSDFYGPGATNTVAGQLVFEAVMAGKRAHWLGSLDAPHSLHFIDDFARGLTTLGEAAEAAGEVWHIPAGGPVTGRAFMERVFAAAGERPRIGLYRPWMFRVLGAFNREMREIGEVVYQFEAPFVVDGSKFTGAFGDPGLTPLNVGIERTLAWYRRRR